MRRPFFFAPKVGCGALLLAALLAACPGPPMEAVGVSHRAYDAATSVQDAGSGDAGPTISLPRDARNARDQVGEPFPSGGHAGYRFVVTLFANDAARPLLEPGLRTAPNGARFVLAHEETGSTTTSASERAGKNSAGPVFTMTRDADRWRYDAYDARGVALALDANACEGCHRDAPNDRVFPVPIPSKK